MLHLGTGPRRIEEIARDLAEHKRVTTDALGQIAGTLSVIKATVEADHRIIEADQQERADRQKEKDDQEKARDRKTNLLIGVATAGFVATVTLIGSISQGLSTIQISANTLLVGTLIVISVALMVAVFLYVFFPRR